MSFLTNAKELAAAREKITALEAQVATLTAQAQTLGATAQEVEAEAAEIIVAKDAAIAKAAEIEKALAAEKLAHEATRLSVEKLAAEKAQHALASVGQPPVAAATKSQGSSVRERYAAMKPGQERAEFRIKNWEALKNS